MKTTTNYLLGGIAIGLASGTLISYFLNNKNESTSEFVGSSASKTFYLQMGRAGYKNAISPILQFVNSNRSVGDEKLFDMSMYRYGYRAVSHAIKTFVKSDRSNLAKKVFLISMLQNGYKTMAQPIIDLLNSEEYGDKAVSKNVANQTRITE